MYILYSVTSFYKKEFILMYICIYDNWDITLVISYALLVNLSVSIDKTSFISLILYTMCNRNMWMAFSDVTATSLWNSLGEHARCGKLSTPNQSSNFYPNGLSVWLTFGRIDFTRWHCVHYREEMVVNRFFRKWQTWRYRCKKMHW